MDNVLKPWTTESNLSQSKNLWKVMWLQFKQSKMVVGDGSDWIFTKVWIEFQMIASFMAFVSYCSTFRISTIVVCVQIGFDSNSIWNLLANIFFFDCLWQQNIFRYFVTTFRKRFELITLMAVKLFHWNNSKLNKNLFLFTYQIIRALCSAEICQQQFIQSILVRLIPFHRWREKHSLQCLLGIFWELLFYPYLVIWKCPRH